MNENPYEPPREKLGPVGRDRRASIYSLLGFVMRHRRLIFTVMVIAWLSLPLWVMLGIEWLARMGGQFGD